MQCIIYSTLISSGQVDEVMKASPKAYIYIYIYPLGLSLGLLVGTKGNTQREALL